MEKSNKLKLFIGLSYIILVSSFLYVLFSNFTFQEIVSYDFIKNNRDYFFNLRENNLISLSILFLLFTILWVFPFLGFGSPIALLGGFILGKWLGVFIVVFGLTIGATFLYMFGNYFLHDYIKKKISSKVYWFRN